MRKLQLWCYSICAVVMFIISCVGCVNVGYLSSSGERINYTRILGKQQIDGFELDKNKDTLKVKFSKQSGDTSDIAATLKNISETLLKVP